MFRVRLDDETVKKLEESAEALNTSKSDIVRKGIESVHANLKNEKEAVPASTATHRFPHRNPPERRSQRKYYTMRRDFFQGECEA